jgi:hypothetical protein
VAALDDIEARVAALGANQREHSIRLTTVESALCTVKSDVATVKTELADFRMETRATLRSFDEQLAEIKDLIVGRSNN